MPQEQERIPGTKEANPNYKEGKKDTRKRNTKSSPANYWKQEKIPNRR